MIAEEAKIRRGKCNTPGRIQPRAGFQPLQQLAFRREFVYESEARKIEVIVLGGVLLRIGHIQISIDLLHVERGKTVGNFFVPERLMILFAIKADGIEVGVVNFDTASTEIRDVEERWSAGCHLRNGRAFVHGTSRSSGFGGVIHYHESVVGKILGIDSRTPGDNRATFGDKREHGTRCSAVHLKCET